jgi:hypothetical protein
VDLDGAAGEPERVGRDEDGAGLRHLLHARGQVRRLTDRRIVHVQVAADRAHDDLAGVEPDPDLHRDALGALDLLGVAADGLLHPEGGVAGADGVILVRDGGAEERYDPVTHHLIHRPLVPVDRLHHALEDGVERAARFFRIAVGQELHGALEVGEQHGDLLALADHGGARGQDLLDQMRGRVRPRRGGRRRRGEPGPAAVTESRAFRIFLLTAGAPHPVTVTP